MSFQPNAAPGWRILLTDTLIVLPRPMRWNSPLRNKENATISNETIRGVSYGHKLFERKLMNPLFWLPDDELDELEDLHDAVSGDVTPFYFYPDSSDTGTSFYVKKEPNFDPQPYSPGNDPIGDMVQWWSYELKLRTMVVPAQILA